MKLKRIFSKLHFFTVFTFSLFILSSLTAFSSSLPSITVDDDTFNVYTLQKASNDYESFVILLLGDGYTKSENDKFLNDIIPRCDALLQTEPYRSYADRINVYAVFTPSSESGISVAYQNEKDTYYHLAHYGNIVNFTKDGSDKARNVKTALENNFLDPKGVVGTIHIFSNTSTRFGSSTGSLFSFSSLSGGAESLIHEISHSIGKLKDEYGRISDGVNTSLSSDKDSLPWRKLLGFGGVGICQNGNDPNGYIPTASCIMRDLSSTSFCEVCKLEISKRLNSYLYTQNSAPYYLADPQITIEHLPTSVGSEYEKSVITNGNLLKANNHSLEFRTVVQNLTDREQKFMLTMQIIASDASVKYFKEETFTVPPLPKNSFYDYEYENSKMSLSLLLEDVHGIVYTDKISCFVTDLSTNTIVKTAPSKSDGICKVVINHIVKTPSGAFPMPNTFPTTLYLKKDKAYQFRDITSLNGYSFSASSLSSGSITPTEDCQSVNFYFAPPIGKFEISKSSDNTVTVTPKDFTPPNQSYIVLAFYNGDILTDVKTFAYNPKEMTYQSKKAYTHIKAMAFENKTSLTPLCQSTFSN